MFPSWIKSKNNIPLPTYFFAILTTNLRLDSASFCFAASSPANTFFASSSSSSYDKSGILPISLKYILTGSSILMPSILARSMSSTFISSTASSSSMSGSSKSKSSSFKTLTPMSSNASNTLSICSVFASSNSLASSPYVIFPFSFAFFIILFNFSSGVTSFLSLCSTVFSTLLCTFSFSFSFFITI